ncbi:MAG: hypothetical protein II844_05925 [Prevotella sp.]|nr:hypothetical protein [Prevotella sp.]
MTKTEDTTTEAAQPQYNGNDAHDTFMRIMKAGGATPEQMEDGRYRFNYRDEVIVAEVPEGGMLMRLFDYNWHSVSRWDAEEVTRLQKLINRVNSVSRARMVYNFDDDDEMTISSIIVAPLTGMIESTEAYFSAQLDALLDLHSLIKDENENENEDENGNGNEEEEGDAE